MNFPGRSRTGRTARFNTSAVHISFQKRPGHAADRLIPDGPEATLTLRSGAASQVQPVDGIYHFDLPDGDEAVLEVFGSQFRIVRTDGAAVDPTNSGTICVWAGTLRATSTLEGVQQRLQILGYYTGAVSPDMNDLAERAILEFQADNALVIDGVPGPRTQNKLDEIFSGHGGIRGTDQPLIRRYLTYFERAAYGPTRLDHPQFDFRGGGTPKLGLNFTPAPAAADAAAVAPPAPVYKLGLFPSNLDESSLPWHAVVRGGDAVLSMSQARIATFSDRLQFTSRATGEDVIEIRQGSAEGPCIAEMDVVVSERKTVRLWGHLLTVRETGTGSVLADPPLWTQAEAQSLIDSINAIMDPMGIRFEFSGFSEHTLDQPQAGLIVDDYINDQVRHTRIARSNNRREYLNIYFTQRLRMIYENADGAREDSEPIAYAGNRWEFNPSCVFTSKSIPMDELGRVIAHEFGHMLRLSPAQYAHSDDRGVAECWRHDIWSRMRLMAKYVYYDNANPDRWWQTTTYGDTDGGLMKAGDLLTIKNFSNDGSDGELRRARLSADNPHAQSGIAPGT